MYRGPLVVIFVLFVCGAQSQTFGVWKSIGDGYILDASRKDIKLYSYTSKYCYTEQNDYLSDLIKKESSFFTNRSKDTMNLFLQNFGANTAKLQSVKKFYKIDRLPDNCDSLSTAQRNNPEFLFDLFWNTLKENYAYAAERKVNWDQIYNDFHPKVNSKISLDSLFQVMGQIVSLTKDQHTKIISIDGKTLQYSGVPSALRLREVFDQQDSVKDFNAYINSFFQTTYRNISDSLLKGTGRKVANGKIEYGELNSSVGYICIHSFAGFASNALPRCQHLDTLNFYMSRIMREFENKKAIIIDVSLNFGGYDAAGLTIAGYFTDKIRTAYTKYVFTSDGFVLNDTLRIYPTTIKKRFTKPVYVLTSDITRSAAETFVLQMKALPNVVVAGTNTLGITSDMLGKSIGDYYLTLSNEKYVTPSGEMIEGAGAKPNVFIDVFPKDNMFFGHRDAVYEILETISSLNIHKKFGFVLNKSNFNKR